MVLALVMVVVGLDQVMKWWAWRHAAGATINDGGSALVGATVGRWYADPVRGALLDLLDFGLLSAALYILVRRRLPVRVLVPGALMIGGWGSNLLDRLGMHYWTAPGSVRGAIDFIHLGQRYYFNVADVFIMAATPAFLLGAGYLASRARNKPATIGYAAPTSHRRTRPRTRMSAFACALGLIGVVGIGAANYGGVTAPSCRASASTHHLSAASAAC